MLNRSKEDIKKCLKFYIPNKYWSLNDWDIIIKRCTEVKENIFEFKCSFYTLYFDKDLHPVSYNKMIVCEKKKNKVYYDFEKGLKYRTEPPVPLGAYDWENQHHWGD